MIENKAEFDGTPGRIRMSLSGISSALTFLDMHVKLKIKEYRDPVFFTVTTPKRTTEIAYTEIDIEKDRFVDIFLDDDETTFELTNLPGGHWLTFDFAGTGFDGSNFLTYKFQSWNDEDSTASIDGMNVLMPNNGIAFAYVKLEYHLSRHVKN